MKKFFFILMGLTAIIGLGACSKSDDNLSVFNERDIIYIVNDGERQTVHITTEAELDSLLASFCDYAESGSSVTFRNAKSTVKGTKETVSFSTTDREEMKRWMRQMENEGKTVTVTFDSETGTYNGMAYTAAMTVLSQWDFVSCHIIRDYSDYNGSPLYIDTTITDYAPLGNLTFYANNQVEVYIQGIEAIYPPMYYPIVYYWTLTDNQDTMILEAEGYRTMYWNILELTDSSFVFRYRDSIEVGLANDTYTYRRH